MEKNEQQMPRLGEPVPAFEAMTTKGKISFPDDYKGKWVILFSHPADFHSDLHDRDTDVRSPYRGVSGAELRIGGLVRGQPQ